MDIVVINILLNGFGDTRFSHFRRPFRAWKNTFETLYPAVLPSKPFNKIYCGLCRWHIDPELGFIEPLYHRVFLECRYTSFMILFDCLV